MPSLRQMAQPNERMKLWLSWKRNKKKYSTNNYYGITAPSTKNNNNINKIITAAMASDNNNNNKSSKNTLIYYKIIIFNIYLMTAQYFIIVIVIAIWLLLNIRWNFCVRTQFIYMCVCCVCFCYVKCTTRNRNMCVCNSQFNIPYKMYMFSSHLLIINTFCFYTSFIFIHHITGKPGNGFWSTLFFLPLASSFSNAFCKPESNIKTRKTQSLK